MTDIDGDNIVESIALFAGELEDFFWQVENNGLGIIAFRFYLQ